MCSDPGLTELSRMTEVPVAGVLPWLPDLWLDAEDTLEQRCAGGYDPGLGR